jgi:OOP family OmpA-OmpF porin
MTRKKIAVLAVASALSIPAYAADTGWFVLGSYGATKFHDVDTSGIGSPTVDYTDRGFKLGGGYMFNKNFGVEAEYVQLGQATVTGTAAFSGSAKAHGEVVAALGVWPINDQFSVLGRLGFINGTVEVSSAGNSSTSTDLKLAYGVGVAYNISKAWSVRVEYDLYSGLGNSSTTGQSDVDLLSLGVVYKFQ